MLGQRCLELATARGLEPGLREAIGRLLTGPDSNRS
jgi:hypothetical protein